MKSNLIKIENIIQSVEFSTYSILSSREATGEKSSKMAFVLFDAGETNALLPVMEELQKSHVEFKVWAFGTAWTIMKNHANCFDIHAVLGISEKINQKAWERQRPLKDAIIDTIVSLFTPGIVITGTVSEIQKQLVIKYKAQGADVIAYYDSFAPINPTDYTLPFLSLASKILVPSQIVADSIHLIDPAINIDIVGQPILEQWIEQNRTIDLQKIREKLHIDNKKPFLVYISGYGQDYEEAFTMFSNAVQYVDHFQIGISLHPKMNGTLERKILEQHDCPHVFFIPKEVDTNSAVAVSDLVVNWRSTVGVLAAFLGKPVVYLDVKGTPYHSLAIEKGWAEQIVDAGDFLKMLIEFETEIISHQKRFVEGGVPQQSTELILRRIIRSKKRAYIPRKPLNQEMFKLFQKTIDL